MDDAYTKVVALGHIEPLTDGIELNEHGHGYVRGWNEALAKMRAAIAASEAKTHEHRFRLNTDAFVNTKAPHGDHFMYCPDCDEHPTVSDIEDAVNGRAAWKKQDGEILSLPGLAAEEMRTHSCSCSSHWNLLRRLAALGVPSTPENR